MPWPIRSAPKPSAAQTDSGPMLSPACAVSRRPALRAKANTSVNHSAGPRSSLPPMPNATTPSVHPLGRQFRHLHAPAPRRTAAPRPESSAPPRGDPAAASRTASKIGANSCPFHSTTPAASDDLRIAHVLRGQPLQQPARDQRIILGRAQALADGAEGLQKGVEIRVAVERAELFDRCRRVQFVQRFRLHRPFQVQMQLGFGHFREEIVHT